MKLFAQIVTYNNINTLGQCLASLLKQDGLVLNETLFISVLDNSDKNLASNISKDYPGISFIHNSQNFGFSKAHNIGISNAIESGADYVLILNQDVRLELDAANMLVEAAKKDTRAGIIGPKLYRANDNLEPVTPKRFDTTGIYITPEIRHLDRGSNEIDNDIHSSQYSKNEYVFGISGACMLLTRSFILDAALPKHLTPNSSENYLQVFDDAFFAYREDADLSWRALALGWRCRYVPAAVGYHTRKVLPERRAELPAELNAYSVRNRFLLQFNNWTFSGNFFCLPRATWRNLLVIFGVILKERGSLGALLEAAKLFPRSLTIRNFIKNKKRLHPGQLNVYFNSTPHSDPILDYKPCIKNTSSLCAVIVNYNSGKRLKKTIETLTEAEKSIAPEISLKTIVVDNNSEDGSVNSFYTSPYTSPSLQFIKNSENLGFSEALNKGVNAVDSEYILILNPDVSITGETLKALVEALNNYQELSAIAPVLKGLDGEIQYHYLLRGLPTIGSTICDLFHIDRLWPGNPWSASYYLDNNLLLRNCLKGEFISGAPNEKFDQPLILPQPAAACLLIRRKNFEQLGGFNPNFYPAWFEDVDYATRAKRAGHLFSVLPSVSVIHEGGYSQRRISKLNFLLAYYGNMLRYWRIHGSKTAYVILRFLIPLSLLAKALVTTIKRLLIKKPNRLLCARLHLQSLAFYQAFLKVTVWRFQNR